MASLLCNKSSVLFACEHMPIKLLSKEVSHPLFSVPQKRLLGLAGDWSAGKLSETESYLLYLSLLDSTELIIWRSPARYSHITKAIIASSMASLVSIVGKINLIQHPSFSLPSFAISHDTADLANCNHWIDSWHSNYLEWHSGLRSEAKREELKTRENALERLIKTSATKPESRASALSEWASRAGDFPHSITSHPITHTRISLSDYWKQLIRACVNDEQIWRFPAADLDELIEHCEDCIPHGSIHSHALMTLLRSGRMKQRSYFGFSDIDVGKQTTSFAILSPTSSAEDANKMAAILAAPSSEPQIGSYPNKFSYLKAKMNWDLAQRYRSKAADGE